MRALPTLLPVVVLLRFMWTTLRGVRGGTSVPLLAGAGANYPLPLVALLRCGSAHNPIEICGEFPFDVTVLISGLSWNYGSACVKLSSSNLFIKPLKILQKGDCFMGEYLAPVENELASVTLADLNMDINSVLDLASDAGANAAIHNQRINAKLINSRSGSSSG